MESSTRCNKTFVLHYFAFGSIPRSFWASSKSQQTDHWRKLDVCFYGPPKKELERIVIDLSEKNSLEHRINQGKKQARKQWVGNFAIKYLLSFRQSEKKQFGTCCWL